MQKIHMRIFFPVLLILIFFPLTTFGIFPVSYTHLDVYKRQLENYHRQKKKYFRKTIFLYGNTPASRGLQPGLLFYLWQLAP